MHASQVLGHVLPRPSKSRVIAACPMLNVLEPEIAHKLRNESFMASAERGEPIWLAGSPAEFVGVCAIGFVKKNKTTQDGCEVPIELAGPGQTFGLMAVVERTPYPLGATAVSNCWYLKIPARAFMEAFDESSVLKGQVLRTVGPRLRHAHEMVGRLAKGRAEERLATVLFILLDAYGKRGSIPIPVTHQDLAEMAGTSPETVVRAMRQWESEGLLRQGSQGIDILDQYGLSARLRP